MKKIFKALTKMTVSATISLALVGAASAQTLSQSPLEASVVAEPNIMLHLDDSLSMYNMVQETGYSRNVTTYSNWTFTYSRNLGSFFPDNIPYETINQGSCALGYIQGSLAGGPAICLRLPDVISGGTWTTDSFYTKHYLDYLFDTYSAASPVDLSTTLPSDYRLLVLRNAAKQLVASRNGIRWCVSDLANSGATFITAACGAALATLNAAIDSTEPPEGGGTPLAESFHELTEYFRGISGYTSPVQYRCQKNFAVVITDGYPTNDIGSTADITNESKSSFNLPGTETLPNWDGLAPATTVGDFNANTVPQYSDGFQGDTSAALLGEGNEGFTLYLDDLAQFGAQIDMFRTGNDIALQPFGDATDINATGDFLQQNIQTYTVGFGLQNQMLTDAAEYGGGANFKADNAAQLTNALNQILADVVGLVGSSAASTATTAFLSSGNQVFQVKYDTNDWSGSLLSFSIESDPNEANFGQLEFPAIWSTDDNFTLVGNAPPTRNILTVNTATDSPVEMLWSNLSSVQQAQLSDDENLFDYILGDPSGETVNGGSYRNRSRLLADVVHSQPVYVKDVDYGYDDPSYQTFLESATITGRPPIVYLGSNAGLLHGFNATADSSGGSEAFAFMPQSAYPLLNALPNPGYVHHYNVDGRSIAIDAQIGLSTPAWATVLVSSMGAGAPGMFALDVTDPDRYSDLDANGDDIFLWELSNSFPLVANSGATIINLASGASVQQSSTVSGGDAAKAIDGDTNGDFDAGSGSVSRTGYDTNAWLEIELDEPSLIDNIVVHNRTDCCGDQLADYSVFVSEAPFESTVFSDTQTQPGVTEFFQAGIAGVSTSIDLDGLAGQYVRVQLSGTNVLSLAEVEINGVELEAEYPDMGHIIDRPSVIRVGTPGTPSTYEWHTITGNGVHSNSGDAVFYSINLTDGSKTQEIVLDDSGNNGIVANTAIDLDGDDLVDRIYLSDLKGNIWRLDWSIANNNFYSIFTDGSGDPAPFFAATESSTGAMQPISAAVEVTRFPGESGSVMLHFGTGKYFDIEDAQLLATEPRRSFYGVVDRGNPSGGSWNPLTKSSLVEQTITTTGSGSSAVRTMSSNNVDYSLNHGWYTDAPSDGERIIFEAIALKDRILFTTIIPREPGIIDPCVPSVTGWLMELDALSGSGPDSVVFDTNGDGDFDDSDAVVISGDTLQAAGIKPSTGAPLPPSIIRVEPGNGQEGSLTGIVSDNRANLQQFEHKVELNRTSWRRLN